jgi:hypothetical protein
MEGGLAVWICMVCFTVGSQGYKEPTGAPDDGKTPLRELCLRQRVHGLASSHTPSPGIGEAPPAKVWKVRQTLQAVAPGPG